MTVAELAALADIKPSLVRQWVRDRIIPEHFSDGKGNYASGSLAFCELMVELERVLGDNSKLPKRIARDAAARFEAAWQTGSYSSMFEMFDGDISLRIACGMIILRAERKLREAV